jgi:hypothetical protein
VNLDLLYTRAGCDKQVAACGRLLVSVILQAAQDASQMPGNHEVEHRANMSPQARTALRWLFSGDSEFDGYCSLLGIDPGGMRRALLDPIGTGGLSLARRRWLRQRATWAGILTREGTE